MEYLSGMITELRDNEVFVFGSNEAGRHGRGAARQAMSWGAVYGVGEGLQGQTYGIPTKDYNINTLLPIYIDNYVQRFIKFTWTHPSTRFLVTEIGCGLAGHKVETIAPMFTAVVEMNLDNVILPERFYNFILETILQ